MEHYAEHGDDTCIVIILAITKKLGEAGARYWDRDAIEEEG
jgi:hypothetical protein